MNRLGDIRYYDRGSGKLLTERVYAKGFLDWTYNTRLGSLMTDLVFRQKWVSQVYGWLHKQRWSKRKIRDFVEQMDINMEESLRSIDEFQSFNDFFTREIDLTKRCFKNDPYVCIAPTDGKILAYPHVDGEMTFRVKRSIFNLCDFLQTPSIVKKFEGGSMVISRLALSDYHHVHFPDSGTPHEAIPIKGKYYVSGPYSLRRLLPFYEENYRMITLFDSDHFGQIAMVEVGAFTVGSVQQTYAPGLHVEKGAHKGFFELGGSTVVLLFEPNAITLDADLCQNTKQDLETYVRLGNSIATR